MVGGTFLTLVAFFLCLLPQQTPQVPPKQNPAAVSPPAIAWHTAGEVGEITVPFEYFKHHIYVTLSINGKPGYVFMLDSGANRNILNLQASRQLGMKPHKLMQEKDIGFGDGRIYVAPEESLQADIGSTQIADVMSVTDLNRFVLHFSHQTDGILGYPFFQRFVIKLDFQQKLMTLLPPDGYSYHGAGIKIGLRHSKDFVIMPITIANDSFIFNRIDVAVDTGSNMTLMLYKPFASQLGLGSSLTHAQPATGFGLNGDYPFSLGTINLVRVGNAQARNVPLEFLDADEEPSLKRNLPGAIGNGILQSFQAVIFDVPHRHIFLELKPEPWQPGVTRTVTFAF